MGDDLNTPYTISIAEPEENGFDYSNTISINNITYTTSGPIDSSTVTLDTMDLNDTGTEFTYNMPNFDQTEFVDVMPSIARLDEMCEMYPALAKAYEQFKLIYKMTEQDFKGKLKERGIDDEIPF